MLTWDSNERFFAHGIDRGVLYPPTIPTWPIVDTNYAPNSRFILTPTGWVNSGATMSWADMVDPTIHPSTKGMRFTHTVTTSVAPRYATGVPVLAGETWTARFRARNQVGARFLKSRLRFVDAAQASLGSFDGASVSPPVGEFRWFDITAKAPANAIEVEPGIVTTSGAIGDVVDVSAWMLYRGSELVAYYDGDSPDDRYHYEYEGADYTSPSLKREIVGTAIPWNGLMGFDEGPDGGASAVYYIDGVVYLADQDASDFSGKLTTMFYPEEFAECVGIPKVTDGLYIDSQKPKRFDFSYRTLVGSGTRGDMFGYQIHLVYQAMASVGTRGRRTLGPDSTPVEFNFDIVCTPVKLPGYRPSAHYIIDTRNMSAGTVAQLEAILYGGPSNAPRLPTPQELFDIMNFGESIIVTVHPGGDTYTVEGASDNVYATDAYHFMMQNINGTDNGDGTYVISDGGNTDVIIE